MQNILDSDQARHFIGPDLGPNCLQRLSVDDTSKQRVKVGVVLGKLNITSWIFILSDSALMNANL